VKLFVEGGADVNAADDYGITPLMVAANMGDTRIIQYLADKGADLGAFDLGKKNDGAFGASVEPLMPVDYAIGVGTFVPNNAIILHEEAAALMARRADNAFALHALDQLTGALADVAPARVDRQGRPRHLHTARPETREHKPGVHHAPAPDVQITKHW
jgi:hypothetical protein